jgi:serine/threonine protein kinase
VAEEETRLIAPRVGPDQTTVREPLRDEARQQPLYDLLPGDPDRLGEFRCLHRLKPGLEPVNADKPTPLLGTAADPATGPGAAPAFVVIKVLTGQPTPDGQIRLREEQAWSAQQGVLRGHGADADVSWVAREFYQGVSLDQLIGQPEWTRARSTSAARMILVGIAQVHARHEIHCDVKPGNVIVNGRRTTLIDFESSRDGTEPPLPGRAEGGRPAFGELRRPRAVEATKAFASPEQLFGGGPDRPILGGTDLFSWGLTVAQMFAPGHHPYCAGGFDENALAAIDRAVEAGFAAPAPDLSALPPGGLRDAVARALAWHPGARGTAADLLAQLGETGTNTEVLVGATRVLGAPVLAVLEEPPPRTRLGRYATSAGVLGDERVGWEQRVAYGGGAVLVAFAAALLTLILLGMVLA